MDKTYNFLLNNIQSKTNVVCAVSGGPDSMVLIDILLKIKKEKKLNIICAHVNHSLREESKEEYEFVKNYCLKHNIIFEGTKFDKYITNNVESEAHNRRYDFFEKIIKKYDGKYLLTAHHGDDLIESILMKLSRGSSLDGYIGFDFERDCTYYKILRPLVFYTKNDILKYAKDNNIEYRIDQTNFSDKYTRNRYRNHILPFLKEENKNVHLKYLKFNEMLKENNNFINSIIEDKYKEIVVDNIINLDILKKEKKFIIKKVIYKYLYNYYKDEIKLIDNTHINNIIDIIFNNKPNLKINLPKELVIQKKYNHLELINSYNSFDYKIELNDEVKVLDGIIKKVKNTTLKNNYVCFLNSKNIKLPLYVRNRKDGDKIKLLGLKKYKKIKDIFINEKIDINKRNKYPLVVDSEDNILWIPGIKKSNYDNIKTGKYDIILLYVKEENE